MGGLSRNVALLGLIACGCSAAPSAPSAPPPPAAATPKCTAAEPREPTDLREVMKRGGSSVKGCFHLGKSTSNPGSMRVALRVSPAGEVKSVSSQAAGSEPGQLSCAEGMLRKLSFARFCGEDVELAWTYSLGGT